MVIVLPDNFMHKLKPLLLIVPRGTLGIEEVADMSDRNMNVASYKILGRTNYNAVQARKIVPKTAPACRIASLALSSGSFIERIGDWICSESQQR